MHADRKLLLKCTDECTDGLVKCATDACQLQPYPTGLRIFPSVFSYKKYRVFVYGVVPALIISSALVWSMKTFCWGCPQSFPGDDKCKSTRNIPTAFTGMGKVVALRLAEKHAVTHNTRRFIFDLPSPCQRLGIPVGREVVLLAMTDAGCICRQYIPINLDSEIGRLEIIVKIYVDDYDKGIAGGQMSQFLDHMKIGEEIEAQGPSGCTWQYIEQGRFNVFSELHQITFSKRAKEIGLIAGGAGITPILRLLRFCETEGFCSPRLYLIYCNRTNIDIIERQYLEKLSKTIPNKFQLHLLVDMIPVDQEWCQGVGRLTVGMIEKYLPAPSLDSFAIVSGPNGMISHSVKLLAEVGYTENRVLPLCS